MKPSVNSLPFCLTAFLFNGVVSSVAKRDSDETHFHDTTIKTFVNIAPSFPTINPTGSLPHTTSDSVPTVTRSPINIISSNPSSFIEIGKGPSSLHPTPEPVPTVITSVIPTISSEPSSSINPSTAPSSSPTVIPSIIPTFSSTNPSTAPSSSHPTVDRPSAFWNYDPTSKWGPKHWDDVYISRSNEYMRWQSDRDNECDDDEQSPVDLTPSSECRDDHQIHGRRGSHDFDTINFVIRPDSLRANLKVVKNWEMSARADYSNLTPDKIPAIYAEVKFPSEHLLYGKQYPGEFRIAHFWKKKGRYVIIAIMMDDSSNKHNIHLEEFIREWEEVYREREHDCTAFAKNITTPYERRHPIRTARQMDQIWGGRPQGTGYSNANWDVYHFLTTAWYCAYEGSLTVPPCSERVYWRVLDLPMKVSTRQFERMKTVFNGQYDENCRPRSSKVYNGGMNRPLQKNRNKVWCCTRDNWKPNEPEHWAGKFPNTYHGCYKKVKEGGCY